MLVSSRVISRIDDIVEAAYLNFMFMIIGDKFLTAEQKIRLESLGMIVGRRPLIELLYILVRQRSTPGYLKDRTLRELLDEIASTGILPIINDTHQYSVDHAKLQVQEAMEASKRELKKRIKQAILKANQEHKTEIEVERMTTIPLVAEKRDRDLKILLAEIAGVALLVHPEFVKSFTTALTNLVNNAAVDSATSTLGAKPEEAQVFKTVINDADLCSWCARFYRNSDGTPKIYSLTELQKNGSNEGRTKSEWKPVLGSTHPRCRCQLHYL